MRTICLISFAVILIFSFGVISSQATPATAVAIDQIVNYSAQYSWSLGWEFDVKTPITVTALGFFDLGSYLTDPYFSLTEPHEVGIYDSAQNLLVSGTVNPGDSLTGFFRYTGVTSTPLPIGTDYRIAAVTLNDYYTWDPGSFTVSPEINFVQDRYTFSSTLVYPTGSDVINGYFGPNFQYEPTGAIPEPATILLLGSGLIGLVRNRSKKFFKK